MTLSDWHRLSEQAAETLILKTNQCKCRWAALSSSTSMDLITVIRHILCRRPKSQLKEELGNLVKWYFNDLLFRRKNKNTHTPNIPQTLKLNWRGKKKKTKRNKTSYVTLFSLKDEAALFPFVRGVMQYCTTKYHPRPKCGRNIHRYINIKISPIQTFLPI